MYFETSSDILAEICFCWECSRLSYGLLHSKPNTIHSAKFQLRLLVCLNLLCRLWCLYRPWIFPMPLA